VAAAEASGTLCLKLDDDDWYAPAFLATMVDSHIASWAEVCRPVVSFLAPFLLFDLARWQLRRSAKNDISGATLLFSRQDWLRHPFRELSQFEDIVFVREQASLGVMPMPVRALHTYVAVRHGGIGGGRDHAWRSDRDGRPVDEYLDRRPLVPGGPEAVLPAWALGVYEQLRQGGTAVPGSPSVRWTAHDRRVRPRLLYVSTVIPQLTGHGTAMRAGLALEGLARSHAIHLLVVTARSASDATVPPPLAALCETVTVASAAAAPRPAAGKTFDVVHAFRLAAVRFARPHLQSAASRQLDLDEVESVANRQVAALRRGNGDAAGAAALERRAEVLEAVERRALREFDRVFVCSDLERQRLPVSGGAVSYTHLTLPTICSV